MPHRGRFPRCGILPSDGKPRDTRPRATDASFPGVSMADPLNCFVPHDGPPIAGAATGPLAGLEFALKDIFDTAGRVTGCGNPDWLRTHVPAKANAPVVDRLLGAGAAMIGKTLTDELAYSLQGENFHYGTPRNSAAPDRIPGGSSCGSVAAVAGKAADFSIGSDTGGSVRVPASLCGVFGMRPTHGRISLAGAMPLAPSYDTVGWFARSAALLERVGDRLLDGADRKLAPRRLLTMAEGFAIADPAVRAALAPAVAALADLLGGVREVSLVGGEAGLKELMLTFRMIQAREIWGQHGHWIETAKPKFGPEIGARFAWAKSMTELPPAGEAERREAFTKQMADLLEQGDVLCFPTAPSIAPPKGQTLEASQHFRDRTLSLTCIAGLARLPQINLPVAWVDGAPVGLSIMMAQGTDRALLALARRVAERLGSSIRPPAEA